MTTPKEEAAEYTRHLDAKYHRYRQTYIKLACGKLTVDVLVAKAGQDDLHNRLFVTWELDQRKAGSGDLGWSRHSSGFGTESDAIAPAVPYIRHLMKVRVLDLVARGYEVRRCAIVATWTAGGLSR